MLPEDELASWIREELSDDSTDEAVQNIVSVLQRSHLFKEVRSRNVLGDCRAIGLRHELIGKYMVARYLRPFIGRRNNSEIDLVDLSCDDKWFESFCFIIDETESTSQLNGLLNDLLDRRRKSISRRLRIVAYALKSKNDDLIEPSVRKRYLAAKIDSDLFDAV